MSRRTYKVGDVLSVLCLAPCIVKITAIEKVKYHHYNYSYNRYFYRVLQGYDSPIVFIRSDYFDEDSFLWKKKLIKRVPKLKAKLYE